MSEICKLAILNTEICIFKEFFEEICANMTHIYCVDHIHPNIPIQKFCI